MKEKIYCSIEGRKPLIGYTGKKARMEFIDLFNKYDVVKILMIDTTYKR